jgi:hypothetical protein
MTRPRSIALKVSIVILATAAAVALGILGGMVAAGSLE